ncbi:MAG: DASH family cryptochrome [Cyanothece sp. SIO2G6]|nr:DASH family cryptochrome [Cyanothece sp. SIO2G6]
MTEKRILIWYRNDLRVHDHEPLVYGLKQRAMLIPVYCFDPRQFGSTRFGFVKTGAFRAQFLLESVADLRRSLQTLGSNLIVRQGEPEVVIPALAEQLGIYAVLFHGEVTSEETRVERKLKAKLHGQGVKFKTFWGSTLYHPDNLPFAIAHIPDLFTTFRKQVEKQSTVDPALATPPQLSPLPDVDLGTIPELSDLGLEAVSPDPRGVLPFKGGETAGLARLQKYIWEGDRLKEYKETRNGMLGADYSSKFSPWLTHGCLSPRYIYQQVQEYETQRVKNKSTYWLIFELLWRDYFRFICAKHGDRVFHLSGLQGLKFPWKTDWEWVERWQTGTTGYPLVDANMRELAATGFMSNRGRQNVASFLTKNLAIDWRIGAEWFESLLIDYDVCSNWGNWNYTAGVGNDARGFRYFNIAKQSHAYDPHGDYVRHWLPELASLHEDKIHKPWSLNGNQQKQFGVILGQDYPNPIVDFWDSIKKNEKLYAS